MTAPCPVCDVTAHDLDPVSGMALGVALGIAFADIHKVTELCCAAHRRLWITGMLSAAMATSDSAPTCVVFP